MTGLETVILTIVIPFASAFVMTSLIILRLNVDKIMKELGVKK